MLSTQLIGSNSSMHSRPQITGFSFVLDCKPGLSGESRTIDIHPRCRRWLIRPSKAPETKHIPAEKHIVENSSSHVAPMAKIRKPDAKSTYSLASLPLFDVTMETANVEQTRNVEEHRHHYRSYHLTIPFGCLSDIRSVGTCSPHRKRTGPSACCPLS